MPRLQIVSSVFVSEQRDQESEGWDGQLVAVDAPQAVTAQLLDQRPAQQPGLATLLRMPCVEALENLLGDRQQELARLEGRVEDAECEGALHVAPRVCGVTARGGK